MNFTSQRRWQKRPHHIYAPANASGNAKTPANALSPVDAQALANGYAPAPAKELFLTQGAVNERLNGFVSKGTYDPNKTPDQETMRKCYFEALNWLRAKSCRLPPLEESPCLDDIAGRANQAGGGHPYFIQNCLYKAQNNGCECNWKQENYGAAGGTGMNWQDMIQAYLCGMMAEPYGVGHRSNIQSKEWTKCTFNIQSGMIEWHNEFGIQNFKTLK